jgi:hypothetical protein
LSSTGGTRNVYLHRESGARVQPCSQALDHLTHDDQLRIMWLQRLGYLHSCCISDLHRLIANGERRCPAPVSASFEKCPVSPKSNSTLMKPSAVKASPLIVALFVVPELSSCDLTDSSHRSPPVRPRRYSHHCRALAKASKTDSSTLSHKTFDPFALRLPRPCRFPSNSSHGVRCSFQS